MQLRPYQTKAKSDTYDIWHREPLANVLMVQPTGAGKTVTMASIIHDHQGACCAIAHRQELVGQISIALAREGIRHRLIAPKSVIRDIVQNHTRELGQSWYDPAAQVAVAGVDTLLRRADSLTDWMRSVTLWVTDECFPAGTMVDGRPIESLKVGDTVTAFNEQTNEFEQRPITRLFKNPAPKHMMRIKAGHHVLHCTAGHPFWTKRGWIQAIDLRNDDELLHVRESGEQITGGNESLSENRTPVLQQGMQHQIQVETIIGNNGSNQSKICIGTDETQQPNEAARITPENVRNTEGDWASAKDQRRERQTSNRSGNDASQSIQSVRVQPSNDCEDRSQVILSTSLQDRLWERSIESSDRSGREQSFLLRTQKTGCEERHVSTWNRVESIQILKSNDLNRSGDCSFDGYVYNIEVDGLHTYTANGTVVHNCHHLLEGNKWGKAAELFPNARGLGVTATPLRADGAGLGRHHDGVFDHMIEGPSMRWLIDNGYLTDYRIFAPQSHMIMDEKTDIGSTGDFKQHAIKTKFRQNKNKIIGDVVGHYLRIAAGKRGIVFVPDVEDAIDTAAGFNAAGVPAEAVSAKTPDRERTAIINRLRRGDLTVLVNVDLFGEGFDLPAIEVVSMARPTMSYALYVQQFGRALRLMDGKKHAIIIDHVGNVQRHNLPDAEPRLWSLDRRERGAKGARDPDLIPTKTCQSCTAVFEAIYDSCPFCGHYNEPAGRSRPEQVDGNLLELDPAVLAQMRGEIERIDEHPDALRNRMTHAGAPGAAIGGAVKNHRNRQEAQTKLRDTIALWAGYQRAADRSDAESYKRFFWRYGVDVMGAQALGRAEAETLTAKIAGDLLTFVTVAS